MFNHLELEELEFACLEGTVGGVVDEGQTVYLAVGHQGVMYRDAFLAENVFEIADVSGFGCSEICEVVDAGLFFVLD